MKLYALIHPFGGNMENYYKGRELCSQIRQKHPDIAVIYILDTIVYEDKTTYHSTINSWCEEIVSRCDGIIVPDGWENSDGCRVEVEAAEARCKEILIAKNLI